MPLRNPNIKHTLNVIQQLAALLLVLSFPLLSGLELLLDLTFPTAALLLVGQTTAFTDA